MKTMNKLMMAIVSGALALGGGSAAFAQGQQPDQPEVEIDVEKQQKKQQYKQDKHAKHAKQAKQVEGEVKATQTVQLPGADEENLVVLLETKDGQNMMIDLGPAQKLEKAQIKEGSTLSAMGQVMDVEGRQLMAAEQLEIEGKKHQIEREGQQPQASQMEREAEQAEKAAEQAERQAEQAAEKAAEQAEQGG